MIITRSPLRITLGGGGTDLPSYYREHGGFLIAAAIDKYVYVTVMRPFIEGIYLKYSKLEHVDAVDDVQHPIIREALQMLEFRTPQVEITTLADIPAGTGLGSSGSFTTALLKALYAHRRRLLHPSELAELACEIEINRLGEPIGKQDQYIAAYGGVTCFTFHPDEKVEARAAQTAHGRAVRPRRQPAAVLHRFFAQRRLDSRGPEDAHRAGRSRRCSHNLHYVKDLGLRSRDALENGRHGAVRRADARALGAQEAALRRDEQSADRRVVRAGPEERRDRRQAGRRRRRRVPDVLRRRSPAAARRDGEGQASKKSASGSTSKARRCCSR